MKIMYSKKDITDDLEKLGIAPTDTLMVHASLKSIGKTEEGADTVLDAFCEYLSPGLLVISGHTWADINAGNPEFDVVRSPVCVGALAEVFRKRQGVCRSLHPTHSLLAYGRDAESFVSGQEKFDTPCSPDSCYGDLEKRNGKVMFIGVNFMKCTLVHCIEEVAAVPGRLTETREQLRVRDGNGAVFYVPSRRHQNANSDYYEKLEAVLEYKNVLIRGKIGDADTMVCPVRDLFRITLDLLCRDKMLFNDDKPVPEEWYINA